jgi:divinyl chlorophyllide a 8-vinyl-reductase
MPEAPGRVILAGATGHIGRAVASEVSARRWPHVIVTRRDRGSMEDSQLQRVCVAAVTDQESLRKSLDGVQADIAISCLASRTGVPKDAWLVDYEANRNLLHATIDTGVRHFVLLSAICVQKPRLEFQRAKLAFETELMNSGIDYTIVRPTAFFKSISGQVSRVLAGKPFLLFGDGTETACKPIGEADLARYIADCVEDPEARNRILPIGGPGDAVTPREQGELLFELAGKPAKFRKVPTGIFAAAAALLGPLGALIPAAAAKAELARIGRYYATESMLVWDEERQRYDAGGTPGFGSVTLADHYSRLLRDGMSGYEAGDQKLF